MAVDKDLVADALVVSDVHAMSQDVDIERFKRFVDLHPAKRLILAGDTLDLYMWRHGRGRGDVAAGIDLLGFLIGLAGIGVEIVILPGNHDADWLWLGQPDLPQRLAKKGFPEGVKELLLELLALRNVQVARQWMEADTVIVHGHEGWQGDWLWRLSEAGDILTRRRLVGREFRRKAMGGAGKLRGAAVSGHGFYRRLASWGRKQGKGHVIHGHTHCEGRRVRGGIVIDCLPAWRRLEGNGGGMVLRGGVWERVSVTDTLTR